MPPAEEAKTLQGDDVTAAGSREFDDVRGPVLGQDSVGSAIRQWDPILLLRDDGRIYSRTIYDGADLIGLGRAIDLVRPPEELSKICEVQQIHAVDISAVPTCGWVSFGEHLSENTGQNGPHGKPADELRRSLDWFEFTRPGRLIRVGPLCAIYLVEIAKNEKGSVMVGYRVTDEKDSYIFNLTFSPGQTAPLYTDTRSADIWVTIDPEGGTLSISRLTLDEDQLSRDVSVEEMPRMRSAGDVLEKLQEEFPWATLDDIVEWSEGELFEPLRREPFFYDGFLSSDDRASHRYDFDALFQTRAEGWKLKQTETSSYELLYVTARNYLRFVELAALQDTLVAEDSDKKPLSNKEVVQTVERILGEMSSESRWLMALELLLRVDTEFEGMVSVRQQREIELFGRAIPFDPGWSRMRFARILGYSKKYPRAVGIHHAGGDIGIRSVFPQASSREELVARIAEVMGHEFKHDKIDMDDDRLYFDGSGEPGVKQNSQWQYEEVWTEWSSVIYPRQLQGRTVAFKSLYQGDISGGYGGAICLNDMIAEARREAEAGRLVVDGQVLSPYDVERAALATAFCRRDRGRYEFLGIPVIGFADVYDAIPAAIQEPYGEPGTSLYETKLNFSRDSDYARMDVDDDPSEQDETQQLIRKHSIMEANVYKRFESVVHSLVSMSAPTVSPKPLD